MDARLTDSDYDALRQWVESSAALVTANSLISAHVDEILPLERLKARTSTIKTSIAMYEWTVRFTVEREYDFQPLLAIPLQEDETAGSAGLPYHRSIPQNLDEIIDQWRTVEPPSIYLASWESNKLATIHERYERTLTFRLIEDDRISTTYQEYRDQLAMERDWPVARSVFLTYTPLLASQ